MAWYNSIGDIMKGKIIVIEGACDGIGKSTQYELLKDKLEKDDRVVTHHFPSYNTSQGAGVEMYLNGEFGEIKDLSPYFVNNLYASDRAITWQTKLKEEYDKGTTILLDRYTTSSIIYQSSLIEDINEKKKFIDFVIDYEYEKLGIGKPDLVIFLTAPFDVVSKLRDSRMSNEGISNDIHEKNKEFLKKVYDNAVYVAKYLNWDVVDCEKNGEMYSIDNIHKQILSIVNK